MAKISQTAPAPPPVKSSEVSKPAAAPSAPPPKADQPHGWLPNLLSKAYNKVKDGLDAVDLGAAKALAPELSKLGFNLDTPPGKPPVLKEPVVMIPGFTMQAASYDPMAQHLASEKANGPVVVYTAADGQFHAGSATGATLSPEQVKGAKIFEVEYSNPSAPSVDPSRGTDLSQPTGKAAEIARAMAAIQSATGQGKVDVVAHSAGCTDFRAYLESRHGGPQIGQAVLVGPASHGTAMGNVGGLVGGPFGLQQGGNELAIGSPLVKSLNDTWAHQRAQIQGNVTIVGVSGAPTPGPDGVTTGDGFMPVDQLGMPGAKTVVLHGLNPTPVAHLTEIGKGGVLSAVDQALGQ